MRDASTACDASGVRESSITCWWRVDRVRGVCATARMPRTRNMLTGDPHRVLNQIGVPIAKVNTVNDVLNEPLFYNDFAHAKDPRTLIE
ncbi:MAG TPA: hypothetical protein VFF70_11805 [Anaerolineae bacterium]|nr:hypothetical protein [Anaerolineae bacterium]